MTRDSGSIQSRYSILLSPEADEKVVSAIRDIEEGYEVGSISSTRYAEARREINDRMEAAWDKLVEMYFEEREKTEQSDQAASLLYCALPSSLHEILSFGAEVKKAAKLKEGSLQPFLETVFRYHDEMLPLAEKARDLRKKVVNGE